MEWGDGGGGSMFLAIVLEDCYTEKDFHSK